MWEKGLGSIEAQFGELTDPRVQGRVEHRLMDIIIIAICAVICGANSWSEVETYGKAKIGWLRRFLELPNGIPSHDTFGRVFSLIEAEAFTTCFMRWIEGVFRVTEGQVMAIDGKNARRSHQKTLGQEAIHLVSAWASANRLSLGQLKVADKRNEITAIPELLKLLDVQGCIVTIDAMGTQTEIATSIIERHADYILALKGNQPHLLEDVQEWFAYAQQRGWQNIPHRYAETINKVSGRVEGRRLGAIEDPLAFDYIRHDEGWTGLRCLIMLQRQRRLDTQSPTELAFYISSLPADAPRLLQAIRDHWSIENTCHWSLDVIFGEDASRVRIGHAPQNFALLRRLALSVLKQDASKTSLNQNRFRAALEDDFLLHLLSQF
jgi:predicted transposase YbfD/YdcC